jgi:hypothetical protein
MNKYLKVDKEHYKRVRKINGPGRRERKDGGEGRRVGEHNQCMYV